jgi:hypothetical protein
MKTLQQEILIKFSEFTDAWHQEQAAVTAELQKSDVIFGRSYTRLVSLNLWRELLLANKLAPESLAFFLEAQNDALVSHVFASQGAWRASLQSLRAFLENVIYCLFFKDHPVENELWAMGRYKPSFTETKEYLSRHPHFLGLSPQVSGIEVLGNEYATLSKAVHGGRSFRMTVKGDETLLWSSERANLGAWATRQANALSAANLILLTMFHQELQGAGLPLLRKAISFTIPPTRHPSIKKKLGVTLYKP